MKTQFLREARLLRALAHPERLAILATLREGPACVCHLSVALGRPQVYLSQQLAILRRAGLIERHREGMFVYYRLRDHGILGLLDLAARCLGRPEAPAFRLPQRLDDCDCRWCSAGDQPPQGA